MGDPDAALAIARHASKIGIDTPTQRTFVQADLEALRVVGERMRVLIAAAGSSEEKSWRISNRDSQRSGPMARNLPDEEDSGGSLNGRRSDGNASRGAKRRDPYAIAHPLCWIRGLLHGHDHPGLGTRPGNPHHQGLGA